MFLSTLLLNTETECLMVKMYVIRIKDGYYAAGSPYAPVPRDRADHVPRTKVDRICATLRKLGYQPAREQA